MKAATSMRAAAVMSLLGAQVYPCLAAAQSGQTPALAPSPLHMMYAPDGRVLRSSAWKLWLAERAEHAAGANQTFMLQPLATGSGLAQDGDLVVVRASDGGYVARWAFGYYLSPDPGSAAQFTLERWDGPGVLQPGESFDLRVPDGCFELAAGSVGPGLRRRSQVGGWSLGCYFDAGPAQQVWPDTVSFDVERGERASEVVRAVQWLEQHAETVRLPSGDLPLIAWQDPTLEPEPTVAYLMTDTLWASKALAPYLPDLADDMQQALLSSGWYGNGLADSLFHDIGEPAHLSVSTDWVHGTLLERCAIVDSGAPTVRNVQIRVPEMSVDASWTQGNSAQFADSAVYTALAEFWRGQQDIARARLRGVIEDDRTLALDAMFWDDEHRVLVDQAARCDYDRFVGECSEACVTCVPCEDETCVYANATYKLGLLLYAARVFGLDEDESLAGSLAQMEQRMWDSQLPDGGLAHLAFIALDGELRNLTGATGEATAIGVLAHTAQLREVDEPMASAAMALHRTR